MAREPLQGTTEVRDVHRFDMAALEHYVRAHVRMVLRGGSWSSNPVLLRSARRNSVARDDDLGYRCARGSP